MAFLISKIWAPIKLSGRDWFLQLCFALIWGAFIAACVTWNFLQRGWPLDEGLHPIMTIYFFGSVAGGYCALLFSSAFAHAKPTTSRFAYFFVALIFFTLLFVAAIFALQHRLYFTQWHAEVGTVQWAFQLVFTGLGSIFLFLISGLRPLLPWGVVGLIIASICFSRGWLSRSR